MQIKHFLYFLFLILVSCSKNTIETPSEAIPPTSFPSNFKGPYRIMGNEIQKDASPVFYKGANALQTYGLTDATLMDSWNVEIVREFIGNVREQPITGDAIFASDNVWYHSLQKIVDANTAHQKITILCPFGWVNETGDRTLLTGLNPREQSFYEAYKIKMSTIATHFKEQPNVWIEVWNEPYHWNNENNYSHALWLNDMIDMVDNIRGDDDFQNVILVPGNEQGQSESAILENGKTLLEGRYNILFDLHAYEKWLVNTTQQEITDRIVHIKEANFAFLFGEVGVHNVSDIMPVEHFLSANKNTSTSVLAWLWNKNSDDSNALLTDEGQPNGRPDNNFWGTVYQDFLKD